MKTVCNSSADIYIEMETFCRFQLYFYEKTISLTFPQLLQLRQQLLQLTSPNNLYRIIENENCALLFVADKKELLFLEVPNLIALKEELLFFFSFDTNNILI